MIIKGYIIAVDATVVHGMSNYGSPPIAYAVTVASFSTHSRSGVVFLSKNDYYSVLKTFLECPSNQHLPIEIEIRDGLILVKKMG